MKALKKLERQQCKQNSAFPLKKTKETALNLSGDLMFHFDHYDVTDDQNEPQVNRTKHTTQNGDSHICSSVDFNSVGQVNRETTDIGNSSDMSQKLSASCLPQMLSDPVLTESLELPKSPPKMEFPHGKMNESMKNEHSYPFVRESLCKDNCTLPMRIGGEPSLNDGGCRESIVTAEGLTIKGKKTNLQTHDVANGESVNHENSEPTNEENVSFERHTSVIKEDTIGVTNDTSGGESIKIIALSELVEVLRHSIQSKGKHLPNAFFRMTKLWQQTLAATMTRLSKATSLRKETRYLRKMWAIIA